MKGKERLKYVAVTDCVSLVPVRMVPQVGHMLIVGLIAPRVLVNPSRVQRAIRFVSFIIS